MSLIMDVMLTNESGMSLRRSNCQNATRDLTPAPLAANSVWSSRC